MTDSVAAPFLEGTTVLNHGITYGGHPVAAAVALKNLEVMEREDVIGNVQRNEPYFRELLDKLAEKPIVGDVRGAGYFHSLELVKDKDTRQTFDEEESEHLLRGFLSGRLFEAGLICRADDRGDPVIQLSPPLVATREDLDYIHGILDTVLDEAWDEMQHGNGTGTPAGAVARRRRGAGRVLTVADILALRAAGARLPVVPAGRRPGARALGAHQRARRPDAVAARRRAAADDRAPVARAARRGSWSCLRRHGLAGLCLGLGFGFDEMPAEAVAAADRLGVPRA